MDYYEYDVPDLKWNDEIVMLYETFFQLVMFYFKLNRQIVET